MQKGLRKTSPEDQKPARREAGPSVGEKPALGLGWSLGGEERAPASLGGQDEERAVCGGESVLRC